MNIIFFMFFFEKRMDVGQRHQVERQLQQQQEETEGLAERIERTNRVTGQVTCILKAFDDRLMQMESTIMPIHEQTQKLARISANLDASIDRLQHVLRLFEVLRTEEATALLMPPQPHLAALDTYCAAIERLKQAHSDIVQLRMRDADSHLVQLRQLIRSSAAKLEQLLRQQWLDYCQRSLPNLLTLDMINSISAANTDSLNVIGRLCVYLASYEHDIELHQHDSTGPNTDHLKVLVDVRTHHLLTLSQPIVKACGIHTGERKLLESSTTTKAYQKGSSPFLAYSRSLFRLLHHEWQLFSRLLSSHSSHSLPSPTTTSRGGKARVLSHVYESVIGKVLEQYKQVAEAILARVKRVSVHDTAGLYVIYDILDLYSRALTESANMSSDSDGHASEFYPWTHAIQAAPASAATLYALMAAFTRTTAHSFFQFLEDTRHSSSSAAKSSLPSTSSASTPSGLAISTAGLPEDGTVSELASDMVGYLKRLGEYREICEIVLQMPSTTALVAAAGTTTGGSAMSGTADQDELIPDLIKFSTRVRQSPSSSSATTTSDSALKKYIGAALDILQQNLEQKSRGYLKKDHKSGVKSALASVFLMNNYHYLLKNIRGTGGGTGTSGVGLQSIVGPGYEGDLERKVRQMMDQYQELTWRPILVSLMEGTTSMIPNPTPSALPSQPPSSSSKPLSKSEKQQVKDRFTAFNDAMEEVLRVQKRWTVADPELRGVVLKELTRSLVPVYQKFLERWTGTVNYRVFAGSNSNSSGAGSVKNEEGAELVFTSHPEKYVKWDVGMVEAGIAKLFDPTTASKK